MPPVMPPIRGILAPGTLLAVFLKLKEKSQDTLKINALISI